MAPPHGVARGRGSAAGLDFRHWLSVIWAQIVDHPDPVEYQLHMVAGTGVDYAEALKCTDPKRLAMYFGKHGSYAAKDYQNTVPELWRIPGAGPGRFWGYWGLAPLIATADLDYADYQLARRIMRRYSARARRWDPGSGRHVWGKQVRTVTARRGRHVDYSTGEVTWRQGRKLTRPAQRFRGGGGFLIVNDGPNMARQLARAIEVCRK
jgi:hypothetical protein